MNVLCLVTCPIIPRRTDEERWNQTRCNRPSTNLLLLHVILFSHLFFLFPTKWTSFNTQFIHRNFPVCFDSEDPFVNRYLFQPTNKFLLKEKILKSWRDMVLMSQKCINLEQRKAISPHSAALLRVYVLIFRSIYIVSLWASTTIYTMPLFILNSLIKCL